jgi:hypothetical protein
MPLSKQDELGAVAPRKPQARKDRAKREGFVQVSEEAASTSVSCSLMRNGE